MTNKTQLRGHCPNCGRIHAAEGGMAKHGYDVKFGFFNGVCHGAGYPAIEISRTRADEVVAQFRAEALSNLQLADRVEAGQANPTGAKARRVVDGKHVYAMVPWAELRDYEQREAARAMVWNLRSDARGREQFADMLENLTNEVHGRPLMVAERPAPAAAILVGERRTLESGSVATVSDVLRARVYWTITREDGSRRKGWTGSQAWRRLPLAD